MTVIVNSAKLQQLVTEIYLALGLSDAQAERLSDSLVAADLWGHSSHGVLRTSWYGERLKTGAMQACADIEILTDTGPLLALDGQESISGHWAVSRQSLPTTDPAEAIVGTLLPIAGHKGFGTKGLHLCAAIP